MHGQTLSSRHLNLDALFTHGSDNGGVEFPAPRCKVASCRILWVTFARLIDWCSSQSQRDLEVQYRRW